MNSSNGERILKEHFPKMAQLTAEQGWSITDSLFDPHVMGNAFGDLDCKVYNIRIVKDRGQIFIRASKRNGAQWHDLVSLVKPDIKNEGDRFSEDTVVRLLRSNLSNIPRFLEEKENSRW